VTDRCNISPRESRTSIKWIYARVRIKDIASSRELTRVDLRYRNRPIRESYFLLKFKLVHCSGNEAVKTTSGLTKYMFRDGRGKFVRFETSYLTLFRKSVVSDVRQKRTFLSCTASLHILSKFTEIKKSLPWFGINILLRQISRVIRSRSTPTSIISQ
jgi:hypothetical protein